MAGEGDRDFQRVPRTGGDEPLEFDQPKNSVFPAQAGMNRPKDWERTTGKSLQCSPHRRG